MEIYLVGGAVRDQLLNLDVRERDWVVVGASAQQMLDLGYKQVGKDFPVFLHPDTHEEYALARTERKTAPGYAGFEMHASPEVTLEEDLLRRDLTINAMAQDSEGNLIDPYNGQDDLHNGLLRHVSNAFSEDPVRILRVARFAARFAKWGFKVSHGTNALMRNMVTNGEVDALVAERVWKETQRALCEDRPSVFFKVLRGCGALAILFPEVDALFGVPQTAKHHAEIDTGIHVMMVVDMAATLSDNTAVRFAALTHDLGKATTPAEILPQHIGHEQRSVALVNTLCSRLKVPNDYQELALLTAKYHTHCHRALELKASTVVDLLQNMDAWRKADRFADFLLACEADARGRKGCEDNAYPQADYLRAAFSATQQVDARQFVAQGLQGAAIQTAMRAARITAVKAVTRPSASV